jgi:hypothetical protein
MFMDLNAAAKEGEPVRGTLVFERLVRRGHVRGCGSGARRTRPRAQPPLTSGAQPLRFAK